MPVPGAPPQREVPVAAPRQRLSLAATATAVTAATATTATTATTAAATSATAAGAAVPGAVGQPASARLRPDIS
jgi:hypothetical protein